MTYRLKQMLLSLPFFIVCGFYLWLVVEPRLIFNGFGSVLTEAPPFLTGIRFLKVTLSQPGGSVTYLAGFLSQGFASSGLGAVIIASVGFCLYDLSRRHLHAVQPSVTMATATLAPIAMFLIYCRYEHPLPEALAVCLGLLVSLFFEKLSLRSTWARLTVYGIITALGFWLMGAGGILVFSLMTCVYGVFVHRIGVFSIMLWGIGASVVWLSAQFIFLIPPQQAFLGLTPFSVGVTEGMRPASRALLFVIMGWVPVWMAILCLVARLPRKTRPERKVKSRPDKRHKAVNAPPSKWISMTLVKQLTCLSVPFVLMGAGLYTDFNAMRKPFAQAQDYSLHKQWDKMLELGRHLPKGQSNVYVSHGMIRALYQTGRLPYDLFRFPQIPHGLFLTHETTESFLTQLTLCNLFMELGQINMAERLASEFLAVKGHNGPVLEDLAWINIYKGQYVTAQVYLRSLQKDLVYRHTADSLLDTLNHGFGPDQRARIDEIRSNMCHDPTVVTNMASPETILLSALQFKPTNKMAFEYLMASYLLTGQIDKIVAHADRLKDLGYEDVPTLYEEAILIHAGINGQKLDLTRFNVKQKTIQSYMRFAQLKNSMTPQNRTAVLNRLIQNFGQTYFFYFTFGRVGLI